MDEIFVECDSNADYQMDFTEFKVIFLFFLLTLQYLFYFYFSLVYFLSLIAYFFYISNRGGVCLPLLSVWGIWRVKILMFG